MANAWILEPMVPSTITQQAGVPDPGFDPANVANDYAGVVWRSSSNGLRSLVVDLGGDRAIDTVMVFGIQNLSTNPTVNIYYKTAAGVGGSWQSRVASAPLFAGGPSLGNGRYGVGLYDLQTGLTARYLLIEFVSGYEGPIQAARVIVGKRIQLERNFSYGASLGVRDLGSLDFSPRGVLQRRRGAKLRTVGLTFSSIYKDEVSASTRPLLERVGNTEMVALVTDPSADADRQNRCYFGPLVGELGHTMRNANAWEAKINLVSIF